MKGNKIFDFSRKGFQDIINIMTKKINEVIDLANDMIPRLDDYISKIDWNKIINSDLYHKVLGDLGKTNEKLETITKLIFPSDDWEVELKNSFKSGTSVRLIGDFTTDKIIDISDITNAKLEVVGKITVLRSVNSNDKLFNFTNCKKLNLIFNVDCNKSQTIGVEYEPMIKFIYCENIHLYNSKIENIPYTGVGFVNSKNCVVENNDFINFFDSGLNIGEGSINCNVKNNSFTCPDGLMNYGSHSLNIYSRGIKTFGHIIDSNTFYDIQSTAIQLTGRLNEDGVELFDVTDCLITNNIVNFYAHNAIKLDGTGVNIKISNNIFKNANISSSGANLNKVDCYGIFTSGQGGRAYSVDITNNHFENCGQYSLRFSANSGNVKGYVSFKNNVCKNSPIYIDYRSKIDTVDIVGNRIEEGNILITNGLNTSTINKINISDNVIKNYNEKGYAIYMINNGCLNFTNNIIETSFSSKNPPYFGYLSATNINIENNNVLNNGGSDNKIRTSAGVINKCVFNNNNFEIYNESDISNTFIKDYVVIKDL